MPLTISFFVAGFFSLIDNKYLHTKKVDFGLEYSLQLDFFFSLLFLFGSLFWHFLSWRFFFFGLMCLYFVLACWVLQCTQKFTFLEGSALFPKFSSRSLINGFIISRSVFDSSEMLFCLLEWLRWQTSHTSPQMIIKFSFQRDFLLFSIMHMLYECLCACSALRSQKRALGPLELEWQCAMSCLMWVLGTQLRPSEEQNL